MSAYYEREGTTNSDGTPLYAGGYDKASETALVDEVATAWRADSLRRKLVGPSQGPPRFHRPPGYLRPGAAKAQGIPSRRPGTACRAP